MSRRRPASRGRSALRRGYIYEPGYWAHDGKQNVWNDGHFIDEREGHRYVPHVLERVASTGSSRRALG